MSGDPAPTSYEGRFPGLDVLGQREHWDPVTTGVVLSRIGMAPDIRFFTPAEQAVATALCDQLLDQHADDRLPVVNLIDARLAEKQTDGWHHAEMPQDSQAWRDTMAALDADATDRYDAGFAQCTAAQQATLIQAVQDLGTDEWHGLSAEHVWSLWTRYPAPRSTPTRRHGTRSASRARRTPVATRTPASTPSSRTRCATPSPPTTR